MSVPRTGHRRPGWTLYRQLLVELTPPTLYALLVLSILVLTEDMLQFSDLVLNRGFGAGTVASLALYRLAPAITWMLPFAVLMGSLIALGRLGADRELLAIEASGISAPRLLPPVLLFATVATLLGVGLSVYAAPPANRALDATLEEMAQRKPWAALRPGRVQRFGNWKLEAQEVSSEGDRLGGVQLWMPKLGETAFAERATLDRSSGEGIRITLERGSVFLNPRRHARQLRFRELTAFLPRSEREMTRTEAEKLSGLTMAALRGLRQRDAEAELQRRFALPAAALVFGALAVPLFMSRARFSRSGGWLLGLAATLVYYGLVQLSSGLIESGATGPVLGVWLPNLVFAALALALLLQLTRMSAARRQLSFRNLWTGSERAGTPTRTPRQWALYRYVGARFVQIAALCFAGVLLAYLVVDVLERLERFATYEASSIEILRYYAARIPLLASRVFPMSLLVATALTVSIFAAQGELIGMRSCGVPAPRGLFPILVICASLVPLYFLLNDRVIPRTNAFAERVNEVEIKNRPEQRASVEVWYREGNSFYEADLFDPDAGIARNVTVYEIGPGGLPLSRADARWGRHVGGGLWRLNGHVRVESHNGAVRRVPAPDFARLGETSVPDRIDTRHLSVEELQQEIEDLRASGIDTTPFRVDLYVKLATPFACLVLPALALFFALGGPPHPSPPATLVFSAVVAVGYTLLLGLGTSLGYGKMVMPAVAGIAPVLVFGVAAGYLGLRLSVFR